MADWHFGDGSLGSLGGGPARPTLFGLVIHAFWTALQPFELLCGFANGYGRYPLFGSHGT